ncbi:hypothetical protein [Streptomyces sp. 2A115]|uniref:hypothetical protein n=1 Tax=Streptomyces sp. 2A115 TaxID=3457439 RepID=UPI003FD41CA5
MRTGRLFLASATGVALAVTAGVAPASSATASSAASESSASSTNGSAAKPTGRVWRVDPRTGKILGWKGGFGSITGIAVNGKGDLYVSELFAGRVVKVAHDGGKRTSVKAPFPGGVAVDPYDGKVYVSAWSIADRNGTVMEGKKTPGGRLWKILGF